MKTRQEIEAAIIKKAAEDEAFLKRLKENPKQAIAKFLPEEVEIPEGVSIKIIQETPTELVLRLPITLAEDEELSAEELDNVSAGAAGYGDVDDTLKSAAGWVHTVSLLGLGAADCYSDSPKNVYSG